MLFAAAHDVQTARRRTTFTTALMHRQDVRDRSDKTRRVAFVVPTWSAAPARRRSRARCLSDPPSRTRLATLSRKLCLVALGKKKTNTDAAQRTRGDTQAPAAADPRQRARGRHEIETGARVPPFPKCHTRVPPL
ncbi:hypothetical protein MRX96_009716 [Rhipicephalus microplus]